jgi:catechol-2,3-dioxygenase
MLETLSLGHLQLPADKPEELARWYAENMGFQTSGSFMRSGGTLIVFSKGRPLKNKNVHFGFRLSSQEAVLNWRQQLVLKNVRAGALEGDSEYQAFRVYDPEGNEIEFFWQETPTIYGIA